MVFGYGVDPAFERDPYIVTREEWGAKTPSKPSSLLIWPVSWVIMTYAKVVPRCDDPDICPAFAQQIQKYHMDRGAPDIPYNFLIGLDWRIYEGRGWKYSCPLPKDLQHLKDKCLVLAYIGPKSDKGDPTLTDHVPAYRLINFGIDNNYIDAGSMDYRHYVTDWNTQEDN